MRYAKILKNDTANGEGIRVSFFVQGCHTHCLNCQNQETWDFNGGYEFTKDTIDEVIRDLIAAGIKRDLSILGGEPLCNENYSGVYSLIKEVREQLPETKIYLWTGNILEDILDIPAARKILNEIDVLIDGPYIEAERDITLPLRGSRNQRVINIKELLNEQES